MPASPHSNTMLNVAPDSTDATEDLPVLQNTVLVPPADITVRIRASSIPTPALEVEPSFPTRSQPRPRPSFPALSRLGPKQSSPASSRLEPKLSFPASSRPEPQVSFPATPPSELEASSLESSQPGSTPVLAAGELLRGRYEIQDLLDCGGVASVYKVKDRYRASLKLQDACVALKVTHALPHSAQLAALGREFHSVQQLSHPNVINVYELDHEGATAFYTMELLDGEPLSEVLKHIDGTLQRRYAFALIREIGAALVHAHSRGVVHADLKPRNVMITRNGNVRVLDFGGDRMQAGNPWISHLSPGASIRRATPVYASLEQLAGMSADPRDDLYALSCIAYELITGKHPFNRTPSNEAAARGMQPRRPKGLRAETWLALRDGLAWSRERRSMPIDAWLHRLHLEEAAPNLPPLEQLTAWSPPQQALMPPAATAALLIAAVGVAVLAFGQLAGVDWQRTLVSMQSTIVSGWHSLQRAQSAHEASPVRALDGLDASADPVAATVAAEAAANPGAAAALAPLGVPTATVVHSPAGSPAAANLSASSAAPTLISSEPPHAAFSASHFVVSDDAPAARVVIHRVGAEDGDVKFVWWTEEQSAKPDIDYAPLGTRSEVIPSGVDSISVYVPIISNPQRTPSATFSVALRDADANRAAAPGTLATVTIE